MVAVLHGADLKPLKVCQGLQVPVGGGEAVGGVLLDAQQFQTGGLIGGGHGGMGLAVAVEHLVDGLAVILGKHHGQVEDSHLRGQSLRPLRSGEPTKSRCPSCIWESMSMSLPSSPF